jgi:hypothetical protein
MDQDLDEEAEQIDISAPGAKKKKVIKKVVRRRRKNPEGGAQTNNLMGEPSADGENIDIIGQEPNAFD